MENFNSIDEIIDFAIKEEQLAVDFYSELAKLATSDEMKLAFEEFAMEEVKHKARLTKIKNEGVFDLPIEQVTDLKLSDYLISDSPHKDMTYEEALIIAMKKEKAAFKLYTKLAQKAKSQELRDIFISLAIEESKHKLRFEIEYEDNVYKEN